MMFTFTHLSLSTVGRPNSGVADSIDFPCEVFPVNRLSFDWKDASQCCHFPRALFTLPQPKQLLQGHNNHWVCVEEFIVVPKPALLMLYITNLYWFHWSAIDQLCYYYYDWRRMLSLALLLWKKSHLNAFIRCFSGNLLSKQTNPYGRKHRTQSYPSDFSWLNF